MTSLPTRLECEEVVARLWPHLDGALPESEREHVIAHLEGCAGCTSHYEFARAFLEAVRRTGAEPAEFSALRERVRAAIAGGAER
jgi:anti-sigma factor (TIGR02949 family)